MRGSRRWEASVGLCGGGAEQFREVEGSQKAEVRWHCQTDETTSRPGGKNSCVSPAPAPAQFQPKLLSGGSCGHVTPAELWWGVPVAWLTNPPTYLMGIFFACANSPWVTLLVHWGHSLLCPWGCLPDFIESWWNTLGWKGHSNVI